LGIFDTFFHATQTRVQAVNFTIHTQTYKSELHSDVGCAESWVSPRLTRAWT